MELALRLDLVLGERRLLVVRLPDGRDRRHASGLRGNAVEKRGQIHLLREEDVLLAREVPEERADRDSGFGRDVVDAGLLVPVDREQPQGGCIQLGAGAQLVAVAPTGVGRELVGPNVAEREHACRPRTRRGAGRSAARCRR